MRIEVIKRRLGQFHVHVAVQMGAVKATHGGRARGVRVRVLKFGVAVEVCPLLAQHAGVEVVM